MTALAAIGHVEAATYRAAKKRTDTQTWENVVANTAGRLFTRQDDIQRELHDAMFAAIDEILWANQQ